MKADWTTWLDRWAAAGIVDPDTLARIRAYEQEHAGSSRLRWPIVVALAFGGLMVGGGVLLFVAAHWDALSPGQRFALVLLMVGGFHVAGALAADRFQPMSVTLHAIGTIALGGGIALGGQIFNLDEHWPGGLMLWAAGAALAWAVLRHTPQFVLTAMLGPAWLSGEWMVASGDDLDDVRVARVFATGIVLLSLAYFAAVHGEATSSRRRALQWLGAIVLLPAAALLALVASPHGSHHVDVSMTVRAIGWGVAFLLPLAVAILLRGRAAWPVAVAAAWILALFGVGAGAPDALRYAWWAAGAVALVAWGVAEGRSERVNMGAALFAATVLAFYFSQVMDKLGRSASLIGLGLLFLGGGWALERTRRRFVQQARGL